MIRFNNIAKILTLTLILSGCASSSKKQDLSETNTATTGDQNTELKNMIQSLSTRIDTLESKMSSTNDRIDATKASLETLLGTGRAKITTVTQQPSDYHTSELEKTTSKADPQSGFVQDIPVQNYRQALMLFQGEKYSDSVISFNSFLERYPDHPLAGHAQYYSGESYFKQKEYKLASREFQQVLTSYDRSPRVPDALRRLADCLEQSKETETAAKQRQLLMGLFPQSPAAQFLAKKSSQSTQAAEPDKPANQQEEITPLDSPPTAPLNSEEASH